MVKTFKFYKDIQSCWYIDLPEWEGEIDELQMVVGADTMLDIIAGSSSTVFLKISDTEVLRNTLELTKIEEEAGAWYTLDSYNDVPFDEPLVMWLCDVVKFIWPDFPNKIYFTKQLI